MRDVRMKGFAERADVEEVLHFLAAHTERLPGVERSLQDCVGQVLAEDVRAEVDVPGFDRAAMDGYAVRGEDTFGASRLRRRSELRAGWASPCRGRPFDGSVWSPAQAVRIMTGAPVPAGLPTPW